MKKIILSTLLAASFAIAIGQTIILPTPIGSVNFGRNVTVLPNGNYVVTDPSWGNGSLTKVGAVYLYNGQNDNLISTLTGSRTDDQVGDQGITILSNGNYVISSAFCKVGITNNAGACTFGNATTGVSGVVSTANSMMGSGFSVKPLPNGSYLLVAPYWSNGNISGVGAVTWCNGNGTTVGTISSSNSLVGSTADDQVGYNDNFNITILPNGNYIVVSSYWDNGSATNAGAVTWGSGTAGVSGVVSSSNSLVGSGINDGYGLYNSSLGVTILPNGNYVVANRYSDNGSATDAGSVTWGSSTAGVSGVVSSANSLVGTQINDRVGLSINILTSGNYIIGSSFWANGSIANAGAATWANASSSIIGVINSTNSLIGGSSGDGVGAFITALTNGNYVVASEGWNNGSGNGRGAVTWCNGITGRSGFVNASNSLINGLNNGGGIGSFVTALSNGNYVVGSPNWVPVNSIPSDYFFGAFTWCSGTSGSIGVVSSANSIVGSKRYDYVGSSITALPNGSYVVISPGWMNGTLANAGAATWGNGTAPIAGLITASNSLIGSLANDKIGKSGVKVLANGNYLVHSDYCANGSFALAGAVTWGSATTGVSGIVSTSNSLMGGHSGCILGILSYGSALEGRGITALSNGNYVVNSPGYKSGSISDAGSVTWGNGATGISGLVNSSNSLVGSQAGDKVGNDTITVLTNGNYVVKSSSWKNGSLATAGAVTWGSGATGISGPVSAANSLVGGTANDQVGSGKVIAYSDGNYVVRSDYWDNGLIQNVGAGTLCNGNYGKSGLITSCNSLIGRSAYYGFYLKIPYNKVYGKLVGSVVDLNAVLVFSPLYNQPSIATESATNATTGNIPVPFLTSSCSIIAALTPSGADPVVGNISATTNIAPTAPTNSGTVFARRSYDITPVSGGNTATATVTLYFTQADFDDYNTNNGTEPDLPTGSADNAGRANLVINQQHGSSATGAFGSYTGWAGAGPANVTITPGAANVIWNANLSRWEVTFTVTGFSGFFIRGGSSVVPIKLLDFTAKALGADNLLEWTATAIPPYSTFEITRSADGRNFEKLDIVAAQGTSYTYYDKKPLTGINYYRLIMKEMPNINTFSHIATVRRNEELGGISVWPLPATDMLTISCSNQKLLGSNIKVINILGVKTAIIKLLPMSKIDVSSWAVGVYFLQFENGKVLKIVKN